MERVGTLVCPVLVGRDDLLAHADRRLDEASTGRGELLFLAGEAGIGKSRLLASIERQAAARHFTVVRAVTFPRDIEVAGSVLLDLGRALGRVPSTASIGLGVLDRLVGFDAGDGAGDAHRRRRLLMLDLVDLLAAIAGVGPSLVSLEDLHWADDLSLEVLAALARRLPELPLIVAGTYRSDELYPRIPMREWRNRLVAGRLAEEATLRRLTADETDVMSRLILGADLPLPRDVRDAILERSDGIPLHVEELLGVIRYEGPGAGSSLDPSSLPTTLDEAVQRRAARLTPSARRVADAASVIGRSFDMPLLEAVLQRPVDQLASAIRQLEAEFFVNEASKSGNYDFRHALIRDSLYRHLPEPARRRIHGRIADAALRDGRFGPEFVSVHLEECGRREEAFRAALDGGDAARKVSAHREAASLFERALRNAPADLTAVDRAALLVALADECAATDDNAAADGHFAAAAALLRDTGEDLAAAALVPAQVAVRHLIGDDIDARADRLTEALTAISALPGEQATQRVRARVLAELSASYMLDRRLGDAIGFGEQSRHLAASVGDEATELHVASTVGSCMVFAGRMDEGWRLLEWAVRRSRDRHREAEAARGYRMMATCASVLVEYDRAETWLREGIEYAERVELWNHRHYMAAHLAHVAWATGDLDVATSLAEHALADGRGGLTTRIIALHTLGFVAMTRGDLERAGVLLEEARRHGARMRELQRLSPALWGLAEVARLEGDLELAMARCREGWEASARVDDAAYLFPFLLTGTRVLLAGGEPAAATAWVEQVTAALAQRDIPGTRAATIHARGLLDLAYGATGRARTALEAAVEQWTDRRRFWEGTWARLDLAACLLRSNRPADARRLLAAAEEAATARQAIPLAEAAEALRRKVGQGGAPDPWSPLTAREFEVAALIADGRTNGEIAASLGLATRTVASHVEHILAKLSVDRRVEVATWANQVRARPDRRAGSGSS